MDAESSQRAEYTYVRPTARGAAAEGQTDFGSSRKRGER